MQAFIQPCNVYAREDVSSDGTVKTLTQSVYRAVSAANGGEVSPRFAVIYVDTNPIRWTRDGTDPNDGTGVGQLQPANHAVPIVLTGTDQVRRFKFTQNTGAGRIHVEYCL
jgi:hypothetical protein